MSPEFSYQCTIPDDKSKVLNFGSCPCESYKNMAKVVYTHLRPGEVIVPKIENEIDLKNIILVANRNLKSSHFEMRGRDSNPLAGVTYPGRSAHLDYITSEIGENSLICKDHVSEVVRHCFGKEMDRHDGMFQAKISDLRDVGFWVFLAPTGLHLLHVRMVHERTMMSGDLPTPHDRQNLVKVFQRVYPLKK